MSVEHKAEALAIHCSDFRFQNSIQQDLVDRGLKDKFDRVTWPGASNDFEAVSLKAKLLIERHDPNSALIYQHEGCALYGENNQSDIHKRDAEKLKGFLLKIKPSLEVTTLIATFSGIKEL